MMMVVTCRKKPHHHMISGAVILLGLREFMMNFTSEEGFLCVAMLGCAVIGKREAVIINSLSVPTPSLPLPWYGCMSVTQEKAAKFIHALVLVFLSYLPSLRTILLCPGMAPSVARPLLLP